MVHSWQALGKCLQASASVCASQKAKPVARRGCKAQGPPSWEVDGLEQRRGDNAAP